MKNPIYSVNKVLINKDGRNILDIKQLDIHRGSCYVIYGDVGSGKSTLLDLLFKKHNAGNGKVLYENKDISTIKSSAYSKEVYHISQDVKLPWFGVSVKDYINKNVMSHTSLSDPKRRIKSTISKMKLNKYLDRDFKKLSDGERRWIELAVSIACDTKVLLIDGFGQYLGEEKINILSQILYRKINYDGVTVIICTHIKERLDRIASVFIRLDQGKIVGVRSKKKRPNQQRRKPSRYGNKGNYRNSSSNKKPQRKSSQDNIPKKDTASGKSSNKTSSQDSTPKKDIASGRPPKKTSSQDSAPKKDTVSGKPPKKTSSQDNTPKKDTASGKPSKKTGSEDSSQVDKK